MDVLFVLSEHRGGLTPERLDRYRAAGERLGAIAGGDVEQVAYEDVAALDADVVVLSGSADPWAAHDPDALTAFVDLLAARRGPTLGICAGLQLQAWAVGGAVSEPGPHVGGRETIEVLDDGCLLAGVPPRFAAVVDHAHAITDPGPLLRPLARSASCAVEAVAATDRPWWGTQFHPELWDDEAPAGEALLERFFDLARAAGAPA